MIFLTSLLSLSQIFFASTSWGYDQIDQDGEDFCAIYGSASADACRKSTGCSWNTWTNTCVSSTSGSAGSGSMYGRTCAEKTESAVLKCDDKQDGGMNQVKNAAQLLAAGASATSGIQSSCAAIGTLSMSANAALGTFSSVCSASYMGCQSACSEDLNVAKQAASNPATAAAAESAIAEIQANAKKCNALRGNVASAGQAMQNLMAAKANMDMCKQLAGNTLAAQCAKDPTLPMCSQLSTTDCSNPTTAASNTVCICQVNPNDSRCGTSTGTGMYSQSSTGTDGLSGTPGGTFGDDGFGGGGYGDVQMGNRGEQASGNLAKGSAGGSRSGAAGGGGQGGDAGGGGAGGSGINTKILNGYVGGRGGSAPGAGGGGAGRGGPGNGQQLAANGQGGENVDLRQFMPGGKMDPQRGLAGVSGPDGITGPHTDIWKKVNKRYFSVAPTLLP